MHPGQWRLERIEVVNWGTFSGLHTVDVPRKGFLLTGESGSGKSSLVDAVSAVLTPRGKTRFNAAAADSSVRSSDRSVLTYVRGAWRRSADADTGEITSQYLRPKATWSGILLRYGNGEGRIQSLVKLFHIKAGENSSAEVKDVSILSPDELGLAELEPYASNGLKTRELKAALPKASVDNEHSRFARRIARSLGLSGERAALLLHKTQSAKNLGSLDELFRKFMLDEPETFARADAAVDQFTELNAAHETVLRARRQVEHLAPLRDQNRDFEDTSTQAERVGSLLEHLEGFTHHRRRELMVSAIAETQASHDTRRRELQVATEALEACAAQTQGRRAMVEKRGGQQLALLEERMETAEANGQRVLAERAEVERKLGSVQLALPADAEQYAELARECERMLADGGRETQQLEQELTQISSQRITADAALADIDRDLDALRKNRSNLPRELLEARRLICQDTGLASATLRFAGELMQVRSDFTDWSGAVERVLRPLALVMLVPAVHAAVVARAVNARHLGASLRYETIGRNIPAPKRTTAANSLVHRVEVADSPMRGWLLSRLADRFDYSCVSDVDSLQEVPRGVTLAGQVKRGPNSFEKNDRHRVDDRRHWVLGFDIDSKLEQLQVDRRQAVRFQQESAKLEQRAREAVNLRLARSYVAEDVVRCTWDSIDVVRAQRQIADIESARATLLANDGDLRAAQLELKKAQEQEAAAHATYAAAQRAEMRAQTHHEALLASLARLDGQPAPAVPSEIAAQLASEFDKVRTQRTTTHESIEADARRAQSTLSMRKEELRSRMVDLHQRMGKIISAFKLSWPESAQDLGDSVEDRTGYLQVLSGLEADRLPEFEDRFFEMLRTQTQQNIAQLRELIQRATREIRRRIEPINSSLLRSCYSSGRYLQIRVEDARPAMAADFLRDLNTVTTGALAPEEDRAHAEERFMVLARLMTQLGSSEAAHRSWRLQVLDVRNHVRFTAIEVDSERNVVDVYDSGAGRSGGQKQKLVVFCLAAALRYQLAGEATLPSYASIVMDEAFDKADTNFTKTAMDIFTEFGFHMILATPMKLLRTLEDYVGGVALVSCEESRSSHIAQVPFEPTSQEMDELRVAESSHDNQAKDRPATEVLF